MFEAFACLLLCLSLGMLPQGPIYAPRPVAHKQGFSRLSCTPVSHLCRPYLEPGRHTTAVHLITFYTEGKPHDGGLDLRAVLVNFSKFVGMHFSSFRAWSRRKVAEVAPHVVQAIPSMPLQLNPGLNAIGYGAFKPWLLLDALKRVGRGEIVMFHDANVKKYPVYAQHGAGYPAMARFVLDNLGADVYMPMCNPSTNFLAQFCKAQVVRELGAGFFLPKGTVEARPRLGWRKFLAPANRPVVADDYARAQARATPEQRTKMNELFAYPLLNAHVVLARKSDAAVALLQEWLDAALHLEWMAPLPNLAPHPLYHWHTPEQAVFSVIAANHVLRGTLPSDYPRFRHGPRGREFACYDQLSMCTGVLEQMRYGAARGGRYPYNTRHPSFFEASLNASRLGNPQWWLGRR